MRNKPIIHKNLPIIEVADRLILDDLYADPISAQYLLARMGPTVAIVALGAMEKFRTYLLKLGHTPKVLRD